MTPVQTQFFAAIVAACMIIIALGVGEIAGWWSF